MFNVAGGSRLGEHAVYPGTFDPVTPGHLDIIERARHLFTRITVLVAVNGDKQPAVREPSPDPAIIFTELARAMVRPEALTPECVAAGPALVLQQFLINRSETIPDEMIARIVDNAVLPMIRRPR